MPLVFTTCTIFSKKWSSLQVMKPVGVKGGIAAKFREEEELSWLSFIWCLSHRLELAISDSLHEHLFSVKQYLCNLFYLYEKSSKKFKELRLLHEKF